MSGVYRPDSCIRSALKSHANLTGQKVWQKAAPLDVNAVKEKKQLEKKSIEALQNFKLP